MMPTPSVASMASCIKRSVPGWATQRIEQASEADLKRWTLGILDAQRIEDVFA